MLGRYIFARRGGVCIPIRVVNSQSWERSKLDFSTNMTSISLRRHVPLNAYLHRFKRKESAQCPACGARKETPQHFLLECPAYAHERRKLKQRRGELEAKFAELVTREEDNRPSPLHPGNWKVRGGQARTSKQRSSQANNNGRGRMKSHTRTLTPHEGEGHEGGADED